MQTINLRDFYPEIYKADEYTDVPDAVAAQLIQWEKDDHAMKEKIRANRAYYSLDWDDGIERDAIFPILPPEDEHEWRFSVEQLNTALMRLPQKQAKRVYAHYYLGLSKVAIAKSEGVDERAVRVAIVRGLRKMQKILKKVWLGVPILPEKSAE